MTRSAHVIGSEAHTLHRTCRLAGGVENELLTLPGGLIAYLAAVLRQEPCPPPECTHDDWKRFLELLGPHWIAAVLYWHLSDLPAECRPPETVMTALHRAWLHAGARLLGTGRQIERVIAALEAEGIGVLLLKGPALARTVYPAAAMRQGSDIDLLIPYDDMQRCENVMAALGYACPYRAAEHAPQTEHHQTFYPEAEGAGPFGIEVHWRLDCGFGLSPDGFLDEVFSRSIRVEADDATFSTLSVPDHLLYQAFHMACQHCGATRLSWIYDIAMLAGEIPDAAGWKDLIRLSVERNCRLSLEAAVGMAEFWTGLTLPPEVSDTALWPAPSREEVAAWELAMRRSVSIPASFQLKMRAIPDARGRLYFLFRFVFPHPDAMHLYRRGEGKLSLSAAYLRRWLQVFR
ncbi:MAG: Uncharacterized protein XE10_0049 [Methanoculleus marisnigri]|jgi:hypothetical protein|uniref:Nucleotidyltransferase family protein n=1 Tax=Methanoculleus marisnigri TaxID=2198 RepID=A0A101J2E6_9EURY|nr:nucleotidyltransferase family protein [Methanoculleus marisnigri]KUK63950.1 MAG: Uncharacterized protein XD82_0022 [Methanoculleus marisnigri]KUL05689.1 MAG: Uncharacterized protein XE10_0049 [Methanoculleus marisnigri]